MGKKVFVSYKHGDSSVENLAGYYSNTARDYVDYLADNILQGDIYKGEGNEDLSKFKDDTIRDHLKDKIYDSSVTLVLISPNMKIPYELESNQWIPWEISYSLKEIKRSNGVSRTNGILAVVLPDTDGLYSYYIEDDTCSYCKCRTLKTNTLFKILESNMFNIKEPEYDSCSHHSASNLVFTGESSYVYSVKWIDFLKNKDFYIDKATTIRDKNNLYNLTKEVKDE